MIRQLRNTFRTLLASVAVCIVGSSFAQEYWKSNYPYPVDKYQAWSSVSNKYLVSFSDMTIRCDKLIGLADFNQQPARINAWTTNGTSVKGEGNELVVTPSSSNDWISANCSFSNWDGSSPTSSAQNMNEFYRSGIIVDMQPANDGLHNAVISGEIFVPELFNNSLVFGYPAYPLGIYVQDAHGHNLDYGLYAVDTIKEFGRWVPFSINYADIQAYDTIGDAFSLHFNGIPYKQSEAGYRHSPVPIDFSNISAVSFLPMNGKGKLAYSHFSDSYLSAEIRLRNIVIGTGSNIRALNVESNGLTNKKYWPDNGCFDDWAAYANDFMVGYHPDSSLTCTGLKGLTYFEPHDTLLYKDWHRILYNESSFSVEKDDSSLLITPFPSLEDRPNWESLFIPFTRWANGKEPIIWNYTLKGSELIGMVVDMRGHKQVSGSIKVSGPLTDNLTDMLLTCNVVDAHGHWLNFEHTQYTQTIDEFGTWVNFTFLYDTIDNKCNGDIYSGSFHGIANPMYSHNEIQRKLVPVDWEHITGISLMLDAGRLITSALSTVEIKDLVVGDPQTAITYSSTNIGPKGSLIIYDHLDTLTVSVEEKYSLTHLFKYKGQSNYPVHLNVESLTQGHKFAIVGDTAISVVYADQCNEDGKALIRFYNTVHQFADSVIVVIPNDEAIQPSFTDIPVQQSVSASVFAPINLKQYISNPCQRKLTAHVLGAIQTEVTIDDTLLAQIGLIDTTWMGTEFVDIQIWYGDKLLKTFNVEFEQHFQASNEKSVLTISNIVSSNYAISPNQPVKFSASIFGADSISWSMIGANNEHSSKISPLAFYSDPGEYDIILTAFNSRDTISDTIRITVVGIVAEQKNVCSGVEFSLTASLADADYKWSTTATGRSINEVLTNDMDYKITVTQGNQTFIDSLMVHVYQPHIEELALATVSKNNKSVVLSWERSTEYGIVNYKVLREGSKTRVYDTIATLPFDSLSVFVDTAANVTKRTYKYALVTENVCGLRSPLSRVHETVNLRIVKDIYGKAGLQWNQYQPDDIYETVAVYRVEKDTLILLEEISGTNTTYTDDKYKLGNEYRVAVILKDSIFPSRLKNDSGPFSQSMSNIAEALSLSQSQTLHDTDVFVYPNPSSGICNIVILNAQPTEYKVSVTDFAGTTVYNASLTASTKNLILLPKLATGVYTLNISSSQDNILSKIVVE